MTGFLRTTVDKFIFKVADDRLYTREGIWVKEEGSVIAIGVSDFVQQHNGDIAFVNLPKIGAAIQCGSELASMETIKVDYSLTAPAGGTIAEINSRLVNEPEIVNQHPYDEGWLCRITPSNWREESGALLNPEQYFTQMKQDAKEEANNK